MDNLPNSLIELNCGDNQITSLNNLPNSLIKLNCCNNKITTLYNLTNLLIEFDCDAGLSDFVFNKIAHNLDDTVKDYDKLMKKYNKQ